MNRFLIFLYVLTATSVCSQTDTIFKKDKQEIICRITMVNNHAIFYVDKNEVGRFIEFNKVSLYSRNGQRKDPLQNTNVPPTTKIVDSVNVSDELVYMRTCLTKFHTQYTTGLSITLIGGALAGTSVFIECDELTKQAVGIGGLVIMLVGVATTFDSHKWINRAGWGVSGKGNMVEVRYRFK